ncbi:MAG: DUF5676 family membrane protein [Candidatus Methylomirabilales bacterium]
MGRLRVMTVGFSVGIFLGVSFLLDVGLWLLWPSLGTQRIWEVLLPGFRWIDPAQFVLGLAESFVMGFYVALIFVPVYNRVRAKA